MAKKSSLTSNNKKIFAEGGDQDGRIEGHGAHLLPQIHKKYIYTWNNSHRIPTERWQKISYNQSCKKDHHVTG